MKKILAVCFVLCLSLAYGYGKYVKYDPYEGELKNEVLGVMTYSKSNITIEKRKLKPISNLQSYATCYEYIIKNQTGHDITIKHIDAREKITQGGMIGRSFIPQKSDFIPGYSIAKTVQTDKESNRFMKAFPENETIMANDSMRVLMLAPKNSQNPVTFTFNSNNSEVVINAQ